MLAGGLVDEVDRLVGQEALGEVAIAEARRGDERLVGDLHLVVRFVLGAQTAEDLDRLVGRRLVEEDGREAALERGILLDVLAVFVERGGADDPQFAAGERGLHHRAGVDGTFGGAGAHHLVELVDEDDHFALGAADLVHDGLEALLEFATELRAGDHRAHVEGEETLVLEVLRHVTGDDLLRETLDDGGLADAGLADDDGVVLRAAVEDLHDALDLLVAADDRIELAVTRVLREVVAVLLERAVLALGGGRVDARAAADVLEGAVDALLVDVVLVENAGGIAVALLGDGDEEVLDADVLVLEALGLGVGGFEHLDDARRRVDLHDVVGELRRFRERVGDARGEGANVDAHGGEDASGEAVLVLEEGEEDVLDVPLGVALGADHLLRGCEDLLCLLCESILSHHFGVLLGVSSVVGLRSSGLRGLMRRSAGPGGVGLSRFGFAGGAVPFRIPSAASFRSFSG